MKRKRNYEYYIIIDIIIIDYKRRSVEFWKNKKKGTILLPIKTTLKNKFLAN